MYCYILSRKSNNERADELSYINEDALSSLARHGNILEKELYQLRVIISKIRSARNGISEELAGNGAYVQLIVEQLKCSCLCTSK